MLWNAPLQLYCKLFSVCSVTLMRSQQDKAKCTETLPCSPTFSRLFSKIACLGTVSRLGFKCAPPQESESEAPCSQSEGFRILQRDRTVTNLNPGDGCRGPGFCPERVEPSQFSSGCIVLRTLQNAQSTCVLESSLFKSSSRQSAW